MEKLTLRQSTIMGNIQGKPVLSTVRAASDGLLLPAGQYLLHPPVENPVYGQVMAIEPLPASSAAPGEFYVKATAPTSGIVKTAGAPAALKDSPLGRQTGAPAIKYDSPSIKYDSPSIKYDSPSIKFDAGAGGAAPPVVITSRPIAGNGFVVTSGLGDLFETVRRAGGVILVVE